MSTPFLAGLAMLTLAISTAHPLLFLAAAWLFLFAFFRYLLHPPLLRPPLRPPVGKNLS